MLFAYGLFLGLFLGGFLSYMFADGIITKTVAEFKKLEGGAVEEAKKVQGVAGKFVSDLKKDL